ncbi:IS5 family transposase [Streptomyces venezuelae]|uniref:IS5 family transposase n=1 Tax=Streptomyces venezuelae TaxID=54571 RepID=UPI0034187CB1
MSDAEWSLIEPLLPPPSCTLPTGGRPEKYDRRSVINAIRYVNRTGCQWRAVPFEYPPWRTVYRWFQKWHAAGVTARICAELHEQVRLREGKNPRSVTVVVDSQTIKADATVSRATTGYDAGKKATGRKRHLAVDTRGLPVMMMVTPANVHDAHAARDFLFRLRLAHPEVTLVWADSAYGGELVTWAKNRLNLTLKTVNRPRTKGFVLLPKRWVVEKSISWIMRSRRNCRDYETLPQHAEAHLAWSVMALMTRRLTKPAAAWREPKPPPPAPVPPLRVRLHPWTVRLTPAP